MVPPSPNELRRKYRHPHAYRRLRDTWQQAIVRMTWPSDRTTLRSTGQKSRMVIQLTIYNVRRYDEDNLQGCQKPVLDALKTSAISVTIPRDGSACSRRFICLPRAKASELRFRFFRTGMLKPVKPTASTEFSAFMERAMGIEPTSEIWVHAATSRARLYRNGRTNVAVCIAGPRNHPNAPVLMSCASSRSYFRTHAHS